MLPNLMPALTRYADGGDIVAQEAKKEIEKLRDLFEKVQDHCAGDAHPRWGRDPATTNSRGYLLDICNSALD